jgi:hypothetical protein
MLTKLFLIAVLLNSIAFCAEEKADAIANTVNIADTASGTANTNKSSRTWVHGEEFNKAIAIQIARQTEQTEECQKLLQQLDELRSENEELKRAKSSLQEKLQTKTTEIEVEIDPYTKLFSIVDSVNKQSTRKEIEDAEKKIIAHMMNVGILYPERSFTDLMPSQPGSQDWHLRLFSHCLVTDCSNNPDFNSDRYLSRNVSRFLIDGATVTISGERPLVAPGSSTSAECAINFNGALLNLLREQLSGLRP